ncbi:MAG: O-antigen ligase family protein [bacterium]|nr:O-antigen ligase family protein [bacterium]
MISIHQIILLFLVSTGVGYFIYAAAATGESLRFIVITLLLLCTGIAALFEPLIPLLGFFTFGILDLERAWETEAVHAVRAMMMLILASTLIKGIAGKGRFKIASSFQDFMLIGITLTVISGLVIKEGMSWGDLAKEYAIMDFVKLVFIYIFMVNLVDSQKKLGWTAWVFFLCYFYLAHKGLSNYRSGDLSSARPYYWWDKNGAAALYVSGIPIAYCLFWTEAEKAYFNYKRAVGRISISLAKLATLGAGGVFLLVALWRCGSRGGYLGFIVTFALLFLIELIRGHYKRLLLILPLVAALLVYKTPEKAWESFSTIETYEEDESSMIRIDAWKTGLIMLKENPFLGVGMMKYLEKFEYYCPRDFPTFHLGLRSPHSIYVQMFSETGLIGFSLFLLLLGKSFWDVLILMWRSRAGPQEAWLGHLSIGFGLSLVGICATGAFVGSPYNLGIYAIVALIVATKKISDGQVDRLKAEG